MQLSTNPKSNSQKLRGILTPNIVPLDDQGRIHESELRRYVDWLIAQGVHGLYPNGSTGEFLRFTADERREIMRIILDQVRGRVPVLAGAAEANTRETIRACETYFDMGATAVAIVSPFYYKLSPRAVYAYFKEIADNTPIDVTLYNIPLFASPIDVPTVERLAFDCPKIVGIKDSSGDLPHMARMIQAIRPHRPEFSFLTGWDAALVPMLLMGCDGGTNASSGVVPEITRKLFDLCELRQYQEAREIQFELITLFDAMIGAAEFPDGFRLGVRLRGFETGAGRQPLTAEQQSELTKLADTLQCLLARHGLTNAPHSGCDPKMGPAAFTFGSTPLASSPSGKAETPPVPTPLTEDQLTQIVQTVLTELGRPR
ncbi:dihydrodipicolinate synthase family protein [Planctopirus hydrillae]|uniref:Dihydrodipicolinate synthase family protein n=1 Tax=Planctopirus hydrillae TaxID=1841610 RepID=A0A1C3EQN0_9PLAN|nr:dihydrodipicolinate synthase family protein [Planctopirus hydrillae]ODA35543.1 dihydrodipicolinate synthase family protein [Planctopirus hydrillae]